MTTEQRRNVEQYLRTKRNDRDRQRIEGSKVLCEECASTAELEWHHIIPFSEGGTDNPSNLAVLCKACHILIHKTNDDYREAGRWGGLVSAYMREERMGREAFCEGMKILAMKRWAA